MQKLNYLIEQTEKEELEEKQKEENKEDKENTDKKEKLICSKNCKNDSNKFPHHNQNDSHMHICRKFKENPAKFFTDKPSDVLLKSLNLNLISSKDSKLNKISTHNARENFEDIIDLGDLSEIEESPIMRRISSESTNRDVVSLFDLKN